MATENKKFMDITVGTKFYSTGIHYEKIVEERISCCQSINAKMVTDQTKRIQVLPLVEVQVDV